MEKNFGSFESTENKAEDFDIRVVSRFRRHADPDKDTEGRSLDSLSEFGIEQAELMGGENKNEGLSSKILKTFHSPKQRAWETLKYMMDGAGTEEARSYEKSELDTMAIPKNVAAEMAWKDKEKGEKRTFDEMIDFILNNPDSQEEIEKIGERMSHRVNVALNSLHYLKSQDDVEMESITHGPVQEAFLKKVVLMEDEEGEKKIGFDSVAEIGGAFKPGEGFEMVTTLDKEGNQVNRLVLNRLDEKGVKIVQKREYEIDWDEVKRLAENYRLEKVAEEKKKMAERK